MANLLRVWVILEGIGVYDIGGAEMLSARNPAQFA